MPAKRIVTGIEELDARLIELEARTQNQIARAALRRATTVFLQHVRRAITSHPQLSTVMKRRFRQLLGQARERTPAGTAGRKAGFGVGKKRKLIPGRSGLNSGGVGISGLNIHWALLGTKDRYVGKTNQRRYRSGRYNRLQTRRSRLTGNTVRYAGRMPAIDVMTRAHYGGGSQAALEAITQTALRQLDRLVEKLNTDNP